MSIEFTIDLIESKKDWHFVTGLALGDIALHESFNCLYQYGKQKNSKKQVATIDLRIESIIVDGEPVESVSENTPAMLAVSGDFDAVEAQVDALHWRKKGGRLIRTSETALTFGQDT